MSCDVTVKAMRLLHVHSGNLFGGVETMLLTLARSGRGQIEHNFALCFEGRLRQELRKLAAPVLPLNEVRTRRPLSVLRARRHLRRLLRQHHFDAVACHMPWAQAIFGPVVRASGRRLIFWMHDGASGAHWLEKWARRSPPDLVLCNSRWTAATLDRIYPRIPYEVWYLPLPLPLDAAAITMRRAVRAELRTPDNAVVILQASRFEPWKGHREHLAALAHLNPSSNWVCWIAGGAQSPQEAGYLDELRALATRLAISDRVRFCGHREDVPNLMRAADIYCQPNVTAEPFGLVFIEALGAGLPIITSGLGGVAELVDGSCALTVPPSNPPALAAALDQLLGNALMRARLGAAGRIRVAEMCDLDRQIARLETIVARLANHYPSVVAACGT